MPRLQWNPRSLVVRLALGLLLGMSAICARASDHLDTPTVTADPAADIGDLYAWISPDGRRLELVLTIVGRRFSDRLAYVFHVDSGQQFGPTTASISILCRFDVRAGAQCWAGDVDYLEGDVGDQGGREGRARRFRVFAGLRDDPFFNNVKGARSALNLALGSLHCGYEPDAAGCPGFDAAISQSVLELWRQTDGGPAANFLAGWTTAALVVSVDLGVINSGGPMLAVWGAVHRIDSAETATGSGSGPLPPRPRLGPQIDRVGRALAAQGLIGLLSTTAEGNQRKEQYNAAGPAAWSPFAADFRATLPIYDALDAHCGNQWLSGRAADAAGRYGKLASLLADDRLWIDSRSSVCEQYLAVELTAAAGNAAPHTDCGGRTPNEDAIDVFRSLLVGGTITGVTDGVDRDDGVHSTSVFPFLAAPRDQASAAVPTTSGAIAIENLDHEIERAGNDPEIVELLLTRWKFLADGAALDRAVGFTESRYGTADDLLRRARVRSLVHRFPDALADLAAAERAGAAVEQVRPLRATIAIATGHADDVLPLLEAQATRHPAYESLAALAAAYAALGRVADADRAFVAASADLDTTSPFPHAWIAFARGQLWSGRGEPARGAALYAQALRYLPQFVAASDQLGRARRPAMSSARLR